jgi:hypothetical protein
MLQCFCACIVLPDYVVINEDFMIMEMKIKAGFNKYVALLNDILIIASTQHFLP